MQLFCKNILNHLIIVVIIVNITNASNLRFSASNLFPTGNRALFLAANSSLSLATTYLHPAGAIFTEKGFFHFSGHMMRGSERNFFEAAISHTLNMNSNLSVFVRSQKYENIQNSNNSLIGWDGEIPILDYNTIDQSDFLDFSTQIVFAKKLERKRSIALSIEAGTESFLKEQAKEIGLHFSAFYWGETVIADINFFNFPYKFRESFSGEWELLPFTFFSSAQWKCCNILIYCDAEIIPANVLSANSELQNFLNSQISIQKNIFPNFSICLHASNQNNFAAGFEIGTSNFRTKINYFHFTNNSMIENFVEISISLRPNPAIFEIIDDI